MQELVEDELRGRVFALLNVAFTSVQVIGMGIGGFWAETVGSTTPPFIGAASALVVVALIGFVVIAKLHLHSKLLTPSEDAVNLEEDQVLEATA